MSVAELSPARQRLAERQAEARAAAAVAGEAREAHAQAVALAGEARRKLDEVAAADRTAGEELAARIKSAVAAGGGVATLDVSKSARARAAAETEATQTRSAAEVLAQEQEAAEKRAAAATEALQAASLEVLSEQAAADLEEARVALATLQRLRWRLVAIVAGSFVQTQSGMRGIKLPGAEWILNWTLPNGDTSRLPQAAKDLAQVWRAYRGQLLEDATAAPPS